MKSIKEILGLTESQIDEFENERLKIEDMLRDLKVVSCEAAIRLMSGKEPIYLFVVFEMINEAADIHSFKPMTKQDYFAEVNAQLN